MDLWEICLTALQHLMVRCPSKIKAHHEQILEVAQRFLTYDPNYSYASSSSSAKGSSTPAAMEVDETDFGQGEEEEEDWGDEEGWDDAMDDDGAGVI